MHTLMMFVVSWSVCSRLNHDTLSYLEHFYRKVLKSFITLTPGRPMIGCQMCPTDRGKISLQNFIEFVP